MAEAEATKAKARKIYGIEDADLAARPTVFRDELLKGKVALVSGAGSGLGKAIAFLFARLGADLVICGRDEEKLRGTERWLRKFGAEVDVHPMTIRDPEQVARLIDAAWEARGGIDILVNNAGGQFPQKAIEFSVKGWNAVIDTNLNGTWYMMQAAARRWIADERPGAIINIVAVFQRGMPDIAHTCAARAGVTYLSKTVAVEWAPDRIRVNCVAPGCIETEGFNVYPPTAAVLGPLQLRQSDDAHRRGAGRGRGLRLSRRPVRQVHHRRGRHRRRRPTDVGRSLVPHQAGVFPRAGGERTRPRGLSVRPKRRRRRLLGPSPERR